MKNRLLSISFNHKLSHLGSCLTALPIIEEIYKLKKRNEKFVLSSGHAGLALYVVLESLGKGDAEDMVKDQGIHPDRLQGCGYIDCSSGSLGCGITIALGMALADRTKNVYCLISDGECSEGSVWESLQIVKKLKINNLILFANINGFSAYDEVDTKWLEEKLYSYGIPIEIRRTNVNQYPFLKGINAHYHVMTTKEYEEAIR